MSSRILKQWIKNIVVLTMLVALSVLGFAHHSHADHAGPMDGATLAFLNAGGQLSDICEDSTEGGEAQANCPVCTLANEFHVPQSGDADILSAGTFRALAAVVGQSVLAHPQLDHAHSSRAPPLT